MRTTDNTAAIMARVRAALQTGVRAGALVIENAAKEYCPVDTGTLRRSIHTEIEYPSVNKVTAFIGPDAPYGIYVEYGTRRMAAQPYMRPAVDQHGDEAREVVKSHVREALT